MAGQIVSYATGFLPTCFLPDLCNGKANMSTTKATKATALSRVRRLAKTGVARALRVSNGLSLAEMGASCDPPVPASTILRWESGDHVPHGDRALGYARLLAELARDDA
jgi:hypothetical protein